MDIEEMTIEIGLGGISMHMSIKFQMVDTCIDQLQSMGARMFQLSQVIGMLFAIAAINLVIGVMNAEDNHFNLMAAPTPPPTTKM